MGLIDPVLQMFHDISDKQDVAATRIAHLCREVSLLRKELVASNLKIDRLISRLISLLETK